MSKSVRSALLLAAMLTIAGGTHAQNSPPPGGPGGGQPPGPPPEAIAACQGKAAGAACSFAGRQGDSLSGTCFAPPARQDAGSTATQSTPSIACRPDRGGPSGSAPPR